MDRKGQATVIFIILIPVFVLLISIIVDTGINMHNEKKIKNVTENVFDVLLREKILEDVNYNNKDEISEKLKKTAKRIYEENGIETEYLVIEIMYGTRLYISNVHKYYSFMNSLFGKGNGLRQISVDAEGYLKDSEVIVEFKDGSNEN